MARPRSRVQVLADIHQRLQDVYGELHTIDLRSIRGDMRESVREARLCVEDAMTYTGEAIQADAAKAS